MSTCSWDVCIWDVFDGMYLLHVVEQSVPWSDSF